MGDSLTCLMLLNLILLVMCIAVCFMPGGLQIHIDNFDLNITPFGLFVLYAIFAMIIIFTSLYCIVLLKINRNKQKAKFNKFLDEFSRLKKLNKNAKPNDNRIPMQTVEDREPLIRDLNPTSADENREPSIVDAIRDADYKQLRLIFSK